MYERRVSRKFYTLMLNRALADLGLALSTSMVAEETVRLAGSMGKIAVAIFFYSNIYSTTITYVWLLLIRLASVARPLQMRGGVRLRTCVRLILFRWVENT